VSEDPAVAGPSRHIGNLIRRAQQTHVACWARDVSDSISSVQYAALEVLAVHPGSSQRELGDALDLDRSTIADLVRRMERSGLLERLRDDTDRRRNVLALSPAGEAAYARLRPRVDRLQLTLVRGLSAEETAVLRGLLARVVAVR